MYSGDVAFRNTTMIELTKSSSYSRGVVWYATAVPLWNAVTGEVASFTTTFSFEIMQISDSPCGGDGMAFFLACYTRDSVLRGTYGAGLLSLFPLRNSGSAIDVTPVTVDSRVVAVEFDTVQNEWDGSSQHVGIDVNSIKSVSYTSTSSPPETNSNNLTSGIRMSATVHYDNSSKLLAADLWIGHTLYRANAAVDLKKELPEEVAVGFSAGTVGLLVWLWRKPRRTGEANGNADFEMGTIGPRRYLYHELAAATDNITDG
ncbi:anti-H(O) lectin 1-like [Miscanthus floridulus]|uniref:anti-H(O) lectin 1-like n=1 Tax=Miscanthus floridulus TaxID=154761 RepID=UPI00345B2580